MQTDPVPVPLRDYWTTEVAAQIRRREVERQMIEYARKHREGR